MTLTHWQQAMSHWSRANFYQCRYWPWLTRSSTHDVDSKEKYLSIQPADVCAPVWNKQGVHMSWTTVCKLSLVMKSVRIVFAYPSTPAYGIEYQVCVRAPASPHCRSLCVYSTNAQSLLLGCPLHENVDDQAAQGVLHDPNSFSIQLEKDHVDH